MSDLKILANYGWTTENIKLLSSKIGALRTHRLTKAYEKGKKPFRYAFIPKEVIKLNKDGDSFELSMQIGQDSSLQFRDKQISVFNINKTIRKFIKKPVKPADIDFEHSKIMDILFSLEFKPRKHINKDGYFVTTVIDRKTLKPVQAYVKQVDFTADERILNETDDIEKEKWEIYVKDFWGKYKRIGFRKFGLDYDKNIISCGYMESDEGRKNYMGIGVRLHQIAIERMIQNRFENVEIYVSPSAFPFHYKCGFRTSTSEGCYDKVYFRQEVSKWSKALGIPVKTLQQKVALRYSKKSCYVDNKAVEEIKKEICRRGKDDFEHTAMVLNTENLKKWIDCIKSQSIMLD